MDDMRRPMFLVLLGLADGARHGYDLLTDVQRLSDGDVRMQVGSLYSLLDRLSERGWLRIAEEVIVRGRARRYFELTDIGREALDAEVARMQRDTHVAVETLRRAKPALP